MPRNVNLYLVFVLAIFTFGCKVLRVEPLENTQQVPVTYNGMIKDSVNSSALSYTSFFSDSILISLVDTALKNNYDLLISLQRMRAANTNVEFTKAALLPTVSGNASLGQRKFGKYTMDGVGNYDTNFSPNIEEEQKMSEHLPDYFLGLEASWEIDVWKKLRNKRKSALAKYLSSAEARRLVVTNLVNQVATKYFELLALDKELEIIRETIELQQNAFLIISIQKLAGAANELAVKQFEAQVLNSRSMELATQQRIVETENQLNFLLARFPQKIERSGKTFDANLPVIHSGIPSDLLTNRPDVRAAEYNLVAAKANVAAAKAAFYPSFNISGLLGFQSFNPAFLISTPASIAYRVFGTLTAPLVNRSAIKAAFKNANASQIESLYRYQKTVLQSYVEVQNELAHLNNLNQTIELQNKQVSVLDSSAEIASDLFRTGRATYLEVLLAQTNALSAKLNLVDTKQKQFRALLNLYKALGGGWR